MALNRFEEVGPFWKGHRQFKLPMMLCTLVFPQNDRQGVQRELSVLKSKGEDKVYAVLAWQPGTSYCEGKSKPPVPTFQSQ